MHGVGGARQTPLSQHSASQPHTQIARKRSLLAPPVPVPASTLKGATSSLVSECREKAGSGNSHMTTIDA